ncbi:12027_t:CDS:2 [Cetraspora pellucida]|uniref:12027_t:CDS:1 n=1 Tax=Cetraspora pellucida TaxID=1433469 RepID=A0A9N9F2P9_9GLOM|nr:12027_t:CDS:2 [Cetraspora pellucida]
MLVGYYPAYKLNLKPGVDFIISSSIDYLNFIAFGPNDLVNNGRNNNSGGDPLVFFNNQSSKFNDLLIYKLKDNLKFKIILSVLLPTDVNNLNSFFNLNNSVYYPNSTQNSKFISDLVSIVTINGFDGIDIDYPFKLPCSPQYFSSVFSSFITGIAAKLIGSDRSLTITAGQYPVNLTYNYVNFVNVQAFHLNINDTTTSAGIDKFSRILSSWNVFVNNSKLVLGVEFGGIVEFVSSNSIKSDIENQHLQLVNDPNFNFPFANEQISELCKYSSYAYLSWENLSSLLSSSSCPTNLTSSSPWTNGFVSSAKQPYLYQQQDSSKYYVTFYEDYQSLSAKLDYINNNNLAGIGIADITKDSKDLQLTNFFFGIQPSPLGKNGTTSTSPPSSTPSSTPRSPISPLNIGVIVGSIAGSIVFAAALVAAGFILYRRKHKVNNAVTTVVALYDYAGKEENDLCFKAGDIIEILERGSGPNDWWVGRLRGVVGEFPERLSLRHKKIE